MAREFYVATFGFAEIEKPKNLCKNGGLWIEVRSHQLHLGVTEDVCAATKTHPAISVRNIKDLRMAPERHRVEIADGDPLEGASGFDVSDRFGKNGSATAQICPIGSSVLSNSRRRCHQHLASRDSRCAFVESCIGRLFCGCSAR